MDTTVQHVLAPTNHNISHVAPFAPACVSAPLHRRCWMKVKMYYGLWLSTETSIVEVIDQWIDHVLLLLEEEEEVVVVVVGNEETCGAVLLLPPF